MKASSVGSVLASSSWLAYAASATSMESQLKLWPAEAAKSLNKMIARNANSSNYAVFDMDNTSWRYDITESMMPFLENRGILTRENLDPSLKLIDFKDTGNYTETLYSYYNRLCEINDMVCYPWAAQFFSGLSLRELKGYVDELMAYNSTISTTYWDGDEVVSEEINPPKVFRGQVELYNTLMNNGIDVYIVSASNEEILRMVATDPKYGYNVKPENVIGVTTMLKNTNSGELTNARMQIQNDDYDQEANLGLVVGPYLWTPGTWYAGKWAAILTYIDEWKRPVLVGGDTPGSDTYMLFHGVDVDKGGIHLWINRSEEKLKELDTLISEAADKQAYNGLEVTANKNWVIVKPEEIL